MSTTLAMLDACPTPTGRLEHGCHGECLPQPTITLNRRQQDAERLYGPLYPWPLRNDEHARAGLPEVFA